MEAANPPIEVSETAPRATTPPTLQAPVGPSAKEKKYDRQLRLWAAKGQQALEESHVLMVVGEEAHGSNSTAAGAETLKNLILPGIGSFTIADAAKVTEADLGVNFFLESESLHNSRSKEMARLLEELNPDVGGHYIDQSLEEWCRPDNLKPYNLILVCAPAGEKHLSLLCEYASQSSIPLAYIHSAGFYSSFSIQLPSEFPIVETHPDTDTISDLRLTNPFSELATAERDLPDFDSMSDHDHGHIPYILILLRYLSKWQESNKGIPSNFKEKTEFREFVRSNTRTSNPEGGEENWDEACAAVLKTIASYTIGSGCKDMFAMKPCLSPQSTSSSFWLIANAIKAFYDKHGVLPLPGTLPDMKATSEGYISLQNVYKSKARADVAEVISTVRSTESALSHTPPIPDAEIEAFCKNASHVRVLINPSNEPVPSLRLDQIASRIEESAMLDFNELLGVFVALNAPSLPSDALDELTKQHGYMEQCIEEVKRAQGAELHNISSVTGGMVAQEAIKLLTRQYLPVEGTCVYDGIRAKVGVFKV